MPTKSIYSSEVLTHASAIFDYLRLESKPIPGDAIMALGSADMQVPDQVAKLYSKAYAFRIIFSGGIPANADSEQKPQAISFFDYLRDSFPYIRPGVVILEPQSTNIVDNVQFTQKLLEEKYQDFRWGQEVKKVILVTTAHQQRRAYYTCKALVPDVLWSNVPPVTDFEQDLEKYTANKLDLFGLLLQELDAIKALALNGWQIDEAIPAEIEERAEELAKMQVSL